MSADTIACIEAERAVLGSLLALPVDQARTVAGGLRVDDLTDPRHRAVLAAVEAVLLAGMRPDPVVVLGQLRRTGLENCTTADRSAGVMLHDLLAAAPVPAAAAHYARVVVEHALRRRLVEASVRLAQVAESGSLDAVRGVVDGEWHAVTEQYARLTPCAEEVRA